MLPLLEKSLFIKFITKNHLKHFFKACIKNQDTYCLGCKKRADNKSITPKQVVNKLIAQKPICLDCSSKKSVFVKENKPD